MLVDVKSLIVVLNFVGWNLCLLVSSFIVQNVPFVWGFSGRPNSIVRDCHLFLIACEMIVDKKLKNVESFGCGLWN